MNRRSTARNEHAPSRRARIGRPDPEALEGRVLMALVAVVTSNADAGPGTLREAIERVNADPDTSEPDRIGFNLPPAARGTFPGYYHPIDFEFGISLRSPLPAIERPAIIDGYTQPGARPNTMAVGSDAVLKIRVSNDFSLDKVTGLEIAGRGVVVRGLTLNRLITLFRGGGDSAFEGNSLDGNLVLRGTSGVTIGGTTPAARNTMAGGEDMIRIEEGSSSNRVIGNYIGIDASGTRGTSGGVRVVGSSGNAIGGPEPGAGNVFAGSDSSISLDASGNTIQGNTFGLDAAGTTVLRRAALAIFGSFDSGENLIGGREPGAGNVFAGGHDPILLLGDGNRIEGNAIGTDRTGTLDYGSGVGVFLYGSGNTVGGREPGAGNLIAFNSKGVVISYSGKGNAILSNSIYSNGIGIDHLREGNTYNRSNPSRFGPNRFQPFPIVASADVTDGAGLFRVRLKAAPNTAYAIQVFANPAADPGGFGQGQTFIGTIDATSDAGGVLDATATFAVPDSAGRVFTATATDPEGNTSEFSPASTTAVADLAVTLEVMPASIEFYQRDGDYYGLIMIRNDGPAEATGLRVILTVPPGMLLNPQRADRLSPDFPDKTDYYEGYANFLLDPLPAGATTRLDFLLRASSSGERRVSVVVSAIGLDPIPDDNVAVVDFLAAPAPPREPIPEPIPEPILAPVSPTSPEPPSSEPPTTPTPPTPEPPPTPIPIFPEPPAILPPVTVPALRATRLTRFASGRATRLVLAFDAPLDVARAEDLDNYRLVPARGLGRRAKGPGRAIRLRGADYDPATRQVTLGFASRLSPLRRYVLTVDGRSPGGLADVAGVPLAGVAGRPGTDFVAEFVGAIDRPARPANPRRRT